MHLRILIPLVAVTLAVMAPASADETRTEVVKFEQGESQAVIPGEITGRESVIYTVNGRAGQFIELGLRPDISSLEYNLYIPGRAPGDEALFSSATGGRKYRGQLYKSGDHSISVFLNRAAARRGETARFDLVVSITEASPATTEEVPSTAPVPQKVIDDCLAALRKQVGQEKGMQVINAKRGEAAFVIDVTTMGRSRSATMWWTPPQQAGSTPRPQWMWSN